MLTNLTLSPGLMIVICSLPAHLARSLALQTCDINQIVRVISSDHDLLLMLCPTMVRCNTVILLHGQQTNIDIAKTFNRCLLLLLSSFLNEPLIDDILSLLESRHFGHFRVVTHGGFCNSGSWSFGIPGRASWIFYRFYCKSGAIFHGSVDARGALALESGDICLLLGSCLVHGSTRSRDVGRIGHSVWFERDEAGFYSCLHGELTWSCG